MAALHAGVQGLLRTSEVCKLVAQLNLISEGKTEVRHIALLSSMEAETEYAVLLLDGDPESFRILYAFPLDSDFKIKIAGELSFSLSFLGSKQVFEFSAQNVSTMWTVVSAVTKAYHACSKRAAPRSGAFSWMQPYINVAKNMDSNVAGLSSAMAAATLNGDLSTAAATAIDNTGTDVNRSAARRHTLRASHLHPSLGGVLDGGTPHASSLGLDASEKQYEWLKSAEIKQKWIEQKMKEHEEAYTYSTQSYISVHSWNVNSKKPTEDLVPWLKPSRRPDFYVIGIQEIDMSAGALLLEETSNSRDWEDAITNCLGRDDYFKLASRQLVGLFLIVFARRENIEAVDDVRLDAVACGVMGLMGNKGGIGARFQFRESTFCFVNAHFVPHTDNVPKRNQNYQDILSKLTFKGRDGDDYKVLEHDHVIWLGDLNYRIPRPDEEVKERIVEKNWEYLMQYDQLSIEMKSKRVFRGFREGDINFAPTYKYDSNSTVYDTSEKKRTPAWTDRILWRETTKGLTLREYTRSELMASDHRPVSALFIATVKNIDEEKQTDMYNEVTRELSKMENEALPEVIISPSTIEVGEVRYGIPARATMTIENVGQVPAQFIFIPKQDSDDLCEPWLFLQPTMGMLIPGKKIQIAVSVLVEKDTAPKLNRTGVLEDILILHLQDGRDHFVTVHGTYLPSCFGQRLDRLLEYGGNVRAACAAVQGSEEEERLMKGASTSKIPKECWELVDFIFKNGMVEEELFEQSGDHEEVYFIREKLDTGQSLSHSACNVHSVAEALVAFLASLEESIIPSSFYKKCLEASKSDDQSHRVVDMLPPIHRSVFRYVMCFLREVIRHGGRNNTTAEKLAIIFSKVLMRSPDDAPSSGFRNDPVKISPSENKKRINFLLHFLKDSDFVKSETR